MKDVSRIGDHLEVAMSSNRGPDDSVGLAGFVEYELRDPDGKVKQHGRVSNLITDNGDLFYGDRGAGIGSQNTVKGMQLGTGTTAVAKTGAGAAIVTHIAGSNKAIDGSFPTSTQPGGAGTARRITWKTTWDAGEATANDISEVTLVNPATLGSGAHAAAATVSRALLAPVVNKAAGDTLAVTWQHDLLGA